MLESSPKPGSGGYLDVGQTAKLLRAHSVTFSARLAGRGQRRSAHQLGGAQEACLSPPPPQQQGLAHLR